MTCFVNAQGWSEPLLGIWGPTALSRLDTNAREGNTGPSKVVKALRGRMVKPRVESWIKGANTQEEWMAMLNSLRDSLDILREDKG